MVESILFKNKEHFLSKDVIQFSPLGKEFKYVGIKRGDLQRFISGAYVSSWVYTFRYVDGSGDFYLTEFNGGVSISK